MDDDLWHVRIAPDDVKQLTLEQLDDLFRLEVIEADTLLWQPGMTEWLPLSVVAGLDEEPAEAEKVSIPVSAPPPRPLAPPQQLAQTSTSWPPRVGLPTPPPKPMTQTASAWPPRQNLSNPPRAAAAPVAWSNPPPKPSVSPYASTVANPVRSAPPPPSARPVINPLASPVPSFVPPSAPLSTAPFARTQYSQRSSGGGWLVVVALAAGAAVTLYRNDLVHAAARSVGSEAKYLELEKALGGPSFGTPRAVEQMAAAAAALTSETPALAPTATTAPASTSVSPSTPGTASTASPGTTSTGTDTTAHAGDTTTASDKSASDTSAPTKPAASKPVSAPAHAAPAHAAPTHAAPTRAASHAAAAPDKPDSMFAAPKKGKKAKGSDYDPLNGSL